MTKYNCPNERKKCQTGAKYAPTSWGTNPAGFYEAMCRKCKENNAHIKTQKKEGDYND